MLGLMKKDATAYLLNLALIGAGSWAYFIATRDTLDSGVVLASAGFMYAIVLSAFLQNEMNEARSGGYSFLASLPVTSGEIAAAKLMLMFVVVAAYLMIAFCMLRSFEATAGTLGLARSYILVHGALCLLAGALMYAGLFRFGFSIFFWIAPIAIVFSVFVIQLLLFDAIRARVTIDRPPFAGFGGLRFQLLTAVSGTLAYGALAAWAIKIKRESR